MVTTFSCHGYQTRSIASRIPYRSRQTPQRHLVHAHAEARLDPVADVPRDSSSIARHAAPASVGIVFREVGAVGGPDQVRLQGVTAAGRRREASSSPRRRKPMFTRLFQSVATHPSRFVGATDPCFVSRAVRAGARPSFSAIAGLDRCQPYRDADGCLSHRTRCPPTRSRQTGTFKLRLLSVAAIAHNQVAAGDGARHWSKQGRWGDSWSIVSSPDPRRSAIGVRRHRRHAGSTPGGGAAPVSIGTDVSGCSATTLRRGAPPAGLHRG